MRDNLRSITALLLNADQQDRAVLDELFPLVYDELRWMAHRHLRGEYGGRTMNTTALVHEAYVKMAGQENLPLQSRAYFFGSAARAMRQILVDYARRRNAQKRGGDAEQISLDGQEIAVDACAAELLELNDALEKLGQLDERLAKVVECRFFGGLTVEETAEVLATSPRTIKRDWRRARAWLYREMHGA